MPSTRLEFEVPTQEVLKKDDFRVTIFFSFKNYSFSLNDFFHMVDAECEVSCLLYNQGWSGWSIGTHNRNSIIHTTTHLWKAVPLKLLI